MNWDRFAGEWKQAKGMARAHWGKLTDDDIEHIAGHKDQLVGKLQERYGMAKEAAEHQAEQWWGKMERALAKR